MYLPQVRISDESIVANYKIQAHELIKFTERWNLSQKVTEPTRCDNILDLIFVNCSLLLLKADNRLQLSIGTDSCQ